ncbi:hypothetical protein ACWGQ5_49480 [Streptomyces sp. NPDC055722]
MISNRDVQAAQAFVGVGGVADDVHDPVAMAGGDQFRHLPGVGELAGLAGTSQPGQHRPGAERQVHDNAGDHPAVAGTCPPLEERPRAPGSPYGTFQLDMDTCVALSWSASRARPAPCG